MTEPTEPEIEAMAKVIGDKAVELARGKWEIEWPWLRDPDSNAAVDLRELACAALTAAAQVKERAECAVLDNYAAENQRFSDKIDRMEHALFDIAAWSKAYPLNIFPEPDFKKAAKLLKAGGITLDAISASNMRHVVEGVGKIARAALDLSTEPDSGPSVLGLPRGEES